MRIIRVMVLVVIVPIVLSGCKETAREAVEALSVGRQILNDSKSIEGLTKAQELNKAGELNQAAKRLKELPRSRFSDKDWAERSLLLADMDSSVIKLAVLWADISARAAAVTVPQRAQRIVATFVAKYDTRGQEWEQFDRVFVEVTGKAIKDAACGTILDWFAPDKRPEEQKGSTDLGTLVESSLQRFMESTPSYARKTVQRFIDLYEWAKSVLEDGKQVALAVESNPQGYLQLVSRPPIQRAAVAYYRYCYSPPKPL